MDEPRPMGANSTTGNVCRRAFSDVTKLSRILENDEQLISRLKNILIAINCSQPIKPHALSLYCKDTYSIYLNNYSWFKMPSTAHRVLAHIGEVILRAPAPIGALEEAAEGRQKLYRQDREIHARKNSRINNLKDIFMQALYSSDPYISSISLDKRLQTTSKNQYPDEVKQFFPEFL